MLIDAHLHLQDPRLDSIRPRLGEVLSSDAIGWMVVNGTTEADWGGVLECSGKFKQVIPSFGLHPWWIHQRSKDWLENLEFLLKSHSSAVGEIGLDRWLRKDNIVEQEEVFLAQWELANQFRLPVTVHCLKAWGRLLDLVRSHPHQGSGFLLHSYSGPREMIDEWIKLGAMFSISGYFAQPRKADRMNIFEQIPMEKLLVETDAPDMLPPEGLISHDAGLDADKRPINHPGNLRRIYQFVADRLGISPKQLELQCEANFKKMFHHQVGVSPNY